MLASSAEVRRKPQPFHFGCRAKPLPEQRKIGLVAGGEVGRDEIVLALEMIVTAYAWSRRPLTIGEGLQVESEQFAALVPTGDLGEGINAWIERRPPVYAGR